MTTLAPWDEGYVMPDRDTSSDEPAGDGHSCWAQDVDALPLADASSDDTLEPPLGLVSLQRRCGCGRILTVRTDGG